MRIATWNVNSIKARLPHVLDFLAGAKPDVLLLQELKCQTEDFPRLEIEAAGYRAVAAGQKSYNGVAVLARGPIEVLADRLPGSRDDPQARYLEARIDGVRVASIYLPNGNPIDSDKFAYKLAWFERLERHAAHLLESGEPVVLAGDYNVIPGPDDVYDPADWVNDALWRIESRNALRRILWRGYVDAFRVLNPLPHQYTFWDYQAGRWQRNEGIRIDHMLLSPQAADRLVASGIDRGPRGREKASDHTPVWCELATPAP
ncbi:MAG: exodeoxyribonuclease III [Alphaproteobacteria bacterium]|nr:exodeoxyribonuclease III [Alphaproteobacteria bacterium]